MVPAIEYQGKALYESLILTEFLEDAYPSVKPSLLPADPYTKAYARIWIDHITKSVVPSFQRLMQAQEEDKQKAALADLLKALSALAQQVKGPYFLGEEFSLVDIVVVPWVVRDYIITEHRGFTRAAAGEAWKQYADKLETRESVLRTISVSPCGGQFVNFITQLFTTESRTRQRNLRTIFAKRSPKRSR